MNSFSYIFLDAVSPLLLAIPFLLLLVIIAGAGFVILWLVAYIRKRKNRR